MAQATCVLVDVGSTYTKAVRVTAAGTVEAAAQARTRTDDLDAGFDQATSAVLADAGSPAKTPGRLLVASSSAAGGLRIFVVGLEKTLTVEAGHQAAMSAGARVVGSLCAAELQAARPENFTSAWADIVLLTGGSSGGDRACIVTAAAALNRLAPRLPVVVAGNEDAYAEVRAILRDERVVRYLPNVMPAVGVVRAEPAQEAIREIFAEHVMGAGRFRSGSILARSVRMPTPAAVLAGVSVLAQLGTSHSWLSRPVIVDVGGATTDVHSVLEDGARRSVEGDLGLRENADSVVAVARKAGLLGAEEEELEEAAQLHRERRDYLPADAAQARADRRLAELACAVALERHAGVLRYRHGPGGGALRATGRDLRDASCVIGTGGIFAHSPSAGCLLRSALVMARARGGLVPRPVPVLADKRYLIWAIGLLESTSAGAGLPLARAWAADCERTAAQAVTAR
jgi:uncharacterized protein (TIGR01319 family)